MYLKKIIFQPPRNMKLLKCQNTTISWRKMKNVPIMVTIYQQYFNEKEKLHTAARGIKPRPFPLKRVSNGRKWAYRF